jgi:hypothetical protein
MALYAFDGTGNEDRDGDDRDTSVLISSGRTTTLEQRRPQEGRGSLYVKGIGTRAKGFRRSSPSGWWTPPRPPSAGSPRNNVLAGDRDIPLSASAPSAALSFANGIASKMTMSQRRSASSGSSTSWRIRVARRHVNAGHNLSCRTSSIAYHVMALDDPLLFPLTRLSGRDADKEKRLQECGFAACTRTSAAATAIAVSTGSH